jgi:ATP-dependent Clp protease adaptor protein ClpS
MPRKPEGGDQVLDKPQTKTRTRVPDVYHVVLHNDDYTTTEFVVRVLVTVFHKAEPDAYRIMMQVHHDGAGIAGAYPFEIAETKVETVHDMARQEGFPLRATVEKA